jgi:integrase
LRWLLESGHITELPAVPVVKASVSGTRYTHRRRSKAPELSPEEIQKVLDELDEWSTNEPWFPIRARFGGAYETTLRPATLDKLKAPENYAVGAAHLTLTDEDDKEAYGRAVPLTLRARRALDSVCPEEGVIFGAHRWNHFLGPAAAAALSPEKARVFTGQHFRSAGITHLLERTGNMPGVQYLAGHKHASTTARYVRPSMRAAEAALGITGPKVGPRKRKARI